MGWPVGAARFLGDASGTDAGSAVAWVVRLTLERGGGIARVEFELGFEWI